MTEFPRAAVYLRISKDSLGEGLGVERQLQSCRSLAEAKGWEIDDEWLIVENDTSATKGPRPGFERLLRGMESGDVHAVLAYKVDRLVRQIQDMVRLWDVAQERKVLVATVAGDLDLTTPSGRSNALLWSVVAQIEIENLRSRLVDKAQQNVQRGRNANGGSRPFGWDFRRMEHHPEEAPVLRRLATMILSGQSLTGAARWLNSERIPSAAYRDRMERFLDPDDERVTSQPRWIRWDTKKVREMLALERHAGRVTYKGKVVTDEAGQPVKAAWEPILDPDTFDRLQAALDGRVRLTEQWTGERRHLLSGAMLICAVCNSKITAFQQTSGKWSYRCRGHLSRDRNQVDRLVLERTRERIRQQPIEITSWETTKRANLSQQIDVLEQRLSALEDEFVSSGGDPARLGRMTAALEAQLESLREERLDRLAIETGRQWVEGDADELLAESASLLPNDDPAKTNRIEAQRGLLAMYVDRVVLHPTKVRGNRFDEDSVDVVFRTYSRLRAIGTLGEDGGVVLRIRATVGAS